MTGDYAECEGGVLAIDELDRYDLLEMDWEKVAIDGIYAAYCATTMKERASVVFSLICDSRCGLINLENIMQAGKRELPGLEQFLPEWVSYLSEIIKERPDDHDCNSYGPSYYAAKLIEEAGMMSEQSNVQISIARKCGYALKTRDFDAVYRRQAEDIYRKNIDDYVKSNAIYYERHDAFATALLDGDFEIALDVGLNKEESLGWSMSFMKQGIALFLLSCYKDGPGSESPPREIQNMITVAGIMRLLKS